MIRLAVKVLFILFSIFLVVYAFYPSPDFPSPPADAVQSQEVGDSEDLVHRRAYFTNYTREEVMVHYQNQFEPLPSFRLNYPPEEAQTIIRDQTRSTFLEEVVHPLRESVFINGFEPSDPKDDVWYKGIDYRQKLIVRVYPSTLAERLAIALLTINSVYLVALLFRKTLKSIKK